MKNNYTLKTLCALLAALMMLTAFAACAETGPSEDTKTGDPSATTQSGLE